MNAEDIREFRKRLGLTQEQLARLLPGTALGTIKAWEGGTLTPHKYLELALPELERRIMEGRAEQVDIAQRRPAGHRDGCPCTRCAMLTAS